MRFLEKARVLCYRPPLYSHFAEAYSFVTNIDQNENELQIHLTG